MIPTFIIFFSLFFVCGPLTASPVNHLDLIFFTLDEKQAVNQNDLKQAKIKVKGTGKTIGDVILLEVTNRDKVNTLRFTVGPALVPGTKRSQPYIIPGTTDIVVPPGGTIAVPIDGICIDPHKPPIRPGSSGPNFGEWKDITQLPEDWKPDPTSGWKPDPNNPVLNPVTEEPIGHTIDIYSHPEEAAPLILTIVESIINATDDLIAQGVINTPISDNPTMERELIIQQTLWITISELAGNPYTVSEFETRVFDLFPSDDIPEEDSPEEEAIQVGIQDFWNTFKAVGVEAKVLPSSDLIEATTFSPAKTPDQEEDNREACAVSSLDLNLTIKIIPPPNSEDTAVVIKPNERGEFIVGQILSGSTIEIECQPEVECECVIITRRGTRTETFRSPCNPNSIEYSSFSSSNLRNLHTDNESTINQTLQREENERLNKLKEELRKALAELDTTIQNNTRRINELERTRDRNERIERDSLIRVNRQQLIPQRDRLARELARSTDRDLRNNHRQRLEQLRHERMVELWKENGCKLEFKVQGRENREVPVNAAVKIEVNGECGSDHQSRCKSARFVQSFEIIIKSR